jgi:GTP-binding protein
VANKWDLIPNKDAKTMDKRKKDLQQAIPHAKFAPMIFTSALTGQHLPKLFPLVQQVYANCHRRIQTSLVNRILMEATTLTPPPSVKNRFFKLLYATQASTAPPTFILFCNDAKLLKPSYHRYLENKLRENIDFMGTPIRVIARSRGEKE